MKFKCGEDPDQYRKRNDRALADISKRAPAVAKWKEIHAHLLVWHEWFAWRPVVIEGLENDCRWLEVIERRGRPWDVSTGIREWHYRAVQTGVRER